MKSKRAEAPLAALLSAPLFDQLAPFGIGRLTTVSSLPRAQQVAVMDAIAAGTARLGDAVPSLARHQALALRDVGLRDITTRALQEAGIETIGRLANEPIDLIREHLGARQSGRGLREIVHASLAVAARPGEERPRLTRQDPSPRLDGLERKAPPDLSVEGARVQNLTGIGLVVAWAAAAGYRSLSAADLEVALTSQWIADEPDLADALRDIGSTPPANLMNTRLAADFQRRPGHVLRSILVETEGDRAGKVFLRRALSEVKPTLQSLGEELTISRERARQLHKRGKAQFAQLTSAASARPLTWCLASMRRRLGSLCPASAFEADPGYTQLSGPTAHPLTRSATLYLLGWIEKRGWVGPVDALFPGRAAAVSLADERGLVGGRDALAAALCERGVREEWQERWLQDSPGIELFDSAYVAWPGNVVDRARLVLWLRGAPMALDELAPIVAKGQSRRAARDRLLSNLARTGLTEVALPEWGLPEYEGVGSAIEQMIKSADGRITLAALQDQIPDRFGVRRGTVAAVARTPRFVVSDGWVRLRGNDEPYVPALRASDLPNVFRGDRETSIAILIHCTENHLKGFSSWLPEGFAFDLGLRPGARMALMGALGDSEIFWNATTVNGPAISSIRAYAAAYGLSVGDAVMVEVSPAEREIVTWGIRAPDSTDADRVRAAYEILGCDPGVEPERAARRLWVANPSNVSNWAERVRLRCSLPGWFQ